MQKKILYLGLDPERFEGEVTHYPVIKIKMRDPADGDIASAIADLPLYTHLIFTSRTAVTAFVDAIAFYHLAVDLLKGKQIIAIGSATAERLHGYSVAVDAMPEVATQEGVVALLNEEPLERTYLFCPHSSLARKVLREYLERRGALHRFLHFYTTMPRLNEPPPDLAIYDEIVFTSPSTVDAFRSLFPNMPFQEKYRAIGTVTAKSLIEVSRATKGTR
ncbi:uroporphyrinogen-III synthase [Simkania negevensis]|uniref:Uroporphyrinogen-III synthase n=1 Tax=Simkania negevensis TaxID=83561 RepID=A0ABS3AQY2_9BACT|nr:uroporphyrinogen-III synthase [Simkania negevensis]